MLEMLVTARRLSKNVLSLIALAMVVILPAAYGQATGETVVTHLEGYSESAKGAHLREQANRLTALVRERKLSEAEVAAIDLQKKFERTFDPKVKQYSFQSKEEYAEFRSSSVIAFEWIDWGYKECLQVQAFIAADRKDFPAACRSWRLSKPLRRCRRVRPSSADTFSTSSGDRVRLWRPTVDHTRSLRATEPSVHTSRLRCAASVSRSSSFNASRKPRQRFMSL